MKLYLNFLNLNTGSFLIDFFLAFASRHRRMKSKMKN